MSTKQHSSYTYSRISALFYAPTMLASVSLPAFAESNTIELLVGGYFPKADTQTRLDSRELEGFLVAENNTNFYFQ